LGGAEIQVYSFLTLEIDRGERSASCCGCFDPIREPWMQIEEAPRTGLDILEERKISCPCHGIRPEFLGHPSNTLDIILTLQSQLL
jgi:hypothetical protein